MINRVVVIGRLTKDPTLRTSQNGNNVCIFSIAVDNRTKSSDGNKTASFLSCLVFQENAENMCKFLKKGSLVGVEGRLNQRKFQRKDGTNGSTVEILCDTVQFLEPKNKTEDFSGHFDDIVLPDDSKTDPDSIDLAEDELPF